MRKFLLASVATLGTTGGFAGMALAQAPMAPAAAPPGAPSQGQVAFTPAASPMASANTNNNYQAPALPGPLANPTPGTVVVHINARVEADVGATWSSLDSTGYVRSATGTFSAFNGTVPAGSTGPFYAKVQPQSMAVFARTYFGVDGMATNGLRYGAGIEFRNNATGQQASSSSDNASGFSSLQTVFVRRMFTYAAGENWGIVRLGAADGLIGIFDNGITTNAFSPTGNLGGGDVQAIMLASVPPTYPALSGQGAEYYNAKLVYLSPQIAGFDFGVQYAPTSANGFGNNSNSGGLGSALTGAGNGTGIVCGAATSGCVTLSSGPGQIDGNKFINQYGIGVRYQGVFGGVGLLAYGMYMGSGTVNYTGPASTTVAGRANLGIDAASFSGAPTAASAAALSAASAYNGKFNGLSLGSGGVAATFAGFTLAANVLGGNDNGQLALRPQGGAPMLSLVVGAKYVAGPFTFGVQTEEWWDQGTIQLAGISQRRGRGISVGPVYTVAPGFQVFGEYLWNDQTQSEFNFKTGQMGSTANNNVHGQGVLIGTNVTF